MQLSQYTSKFGPGESYNLLYLESLELAVEASLVEEGVLGKSFSNRANYSSDPEKSACVTERSQESHLLLEIVLQ